MKFFSKLANIFGNGNTQTIISNNIVGDCSVTINGVTHINCGNSIRIDDKGQIFFGNKDITPEGRIINITVTGHVDEIKLSACTTLTVNGDVDTLDAGMGNVVCNNVTGNVKSNMGRVECKDVAGKVETNGGNIRCNNITNSVKTTMGKVECEGSIGGNVETNMGNISATEIKGTVVTKMGNVKYK